MQSTESNGTTVHKDITFTVAIGNQWLNCFTITGSVLVQRLWGIVSAVTTFTNCTSACFDLNDGAATIQLTAASGVLSGMPVGTIFAKAGLAAAAFVVLDNTAGDVGESTVPLEWSESIVTQKSGQPTYLRMGISTTDNPVAVVMRISCQWVPLTPGSKVT